MFRSFCPCGDLDGQFWIGMNWVRQVSIGHWTFISFNVEYLLGLPRSQRPMHTLGQFHVEAQFSRLFSALEVFTKSIAEVNSQEITRCQCFRQFHRMLCLDWRSCPSKLWLHFTQAPSEFCWQNKLDLWSRISNFQVDIMYYWKHIWELRGGVSFDPGNVWTCLKHVSLWVLESFGPLIGWLWLTMVGYGFLVICLQCCLNLFPVTGNSSEFVRRVPRGWISKKGHCLTPQCIKSWMQSIWITMNQNRW